MLTILGTVVILFIFYNIFVEGMSKVTSTNSSDNKSLLDIILDLFFLIIEKAFTASIIFIIVSVIWFVVTAIYDLFHQPNYLNKNQGVSHSTYIEPQKNKNILNSKLFNGEWIGDGEQTNGHKWSIRINIDSIKKKYTIDYPSLNCGGRLDFISTSGNKIEFYENFTYGYSRCVQGKVVLIKTSDNQSDFLWYDSNGRQDGWGKVERGVSKYKKEKPKKLSFSDAMRHKNIIGKKLYIDNLSKVKRLSSFAVTSIQVMQTYDIIESKIPVGPNQVLNQTQLNMLQNFIKKNRHLCQPRRGEVFMEYLGRLCEYKDVSVGNLGVKH